MAVDAAGNCYVAGEIQGAAEFSGKPVTSFGGQDILVAKYSATGELQWVRSAGGRYDDAGLGIGVDAAGNCYVVGEFGFGAGGTAQFGSTNITSPGRWAVFIAKYRSNGDLEWVRTRSNPRERGTAIAVDAQGNHWITGNTDDQTVIVERRDSQGVSLWSRSWADGTYGHGRGISADREGNCYVTGDISNQGGTRAFMVKYDRFGTLQWARQSSGSGVNCYVTGTAVDRRGNCYTAGYFGLTAGGVARFDALSITNAGLYDIFFAKYNSNGVVQWVRRAGSSRTDSGDSANAIAVDPTGIVCITGACSTGATFGNIQVVGANQFFYVAAFDEAGTALWVAQPQPAAVMMSGGSGVAFDPSGACYVGGHFASRLTFGTFAVTNLGGVDGYGDLLVTKLGRSSLPPILISTPESLAVQPGDVVMLVVNASGVGPLFYQWFLEGRSLENATNAVLELVDIQHEQSGAYTVQVRNRGGTVGSAPAFIDVIVPIAIQVTTLAGSGVPGDTDSVQALQAQFNRPNGPVISPDGTIYLADVGNHRLRFITPGGAVGTFAGRDGPGFLNGSAPIARLNGALGLALDAAGDLLIADTVNNRVRRAVRFGLQTVTTLAGNGSVGGRDGPAAEATFNYPNDLVQDASGNTYVTEFNNHRIRKIDRFGQVMTVAGDGVPGYADGPGWQARFNQPAGITLDSSGNLYVTEWSNHRVRRIDTDGTVRTVAGSGTPGFLDGQAGEAQLNQPDGIAADRAGVLYFTEFGNHAIRCLTRGGYVQTVAGRGTPGFANGDRTSALFNAPSGIAVHPDGSLIVTESLNHRVRRVELDAGTTHGVPPQPLLTLRLNPVLTIYGLPGETYRIDYAEEARPNDWIALTNVTLSGNMATWADPRPTTSTRRTYRATRP